MLTLATPAGNVTLSGASAVAARRIYRAAIRAGWEIRTMDLADGVVVLRPINQGDNRVLTARRVADAGRWQVVIERWGMRQHHVGRGARDGTVVERWALLSQSWLTAPDGSRTFVGGAAAFRAIGAHITDNPGRALAVRDCKRVAPTASAVTGADQ